MKIVVIGTGGVGGYFGGLLCKGGNDVTFIGRGEHRMAILENGLTVKSIKGDFNVKDVQITENIREAGPADVIIIALKAWQVRPLLDDIASIVKDETVIIPLENGVSTPDELIEKIPSRHVVGGMCRIISMIESPGVITHTGVDPVMIFGELDGALSDRLIRIKELFAASGIDARVSADIKSEMWRKFISICVSGLLAVCRATYGEMREIPQTRQMMRDLMSEIYLLSKAAGVKVEPDYVDKAMAFIDTYSYDATSSLTRDVWDGKFSEIEYQNGTVVRLAERYGIDVPLNRFVYASILPVQRRALNR